MTWSTCWPQPAQVVLPQTLQLTGRHMVVLLRLMGRRNWTRGSGCRGDGQAGAGGILAVAVVDGDHGDTAGGEDGGGDGGAVPAGTVHPHLPGGDLADAAEELVQGDVHGAVDVAL